MKLLETLTVTLFITGSLFVTGITIEFIIKQVNNMSKTLIRKQTVLKYYPEAKCLAIPTVNGKSYHEIWSDRIYLGKGKTAQNAWSAAYKNTVD